MLCVAAGVHTSVPTMDRCTLRGPPCLCGLDGVRLRCPPAPPKSPGPGGVAGSPQGHEGLTFH